MFSDFFLTKHGKWFSITYSLNKYFPFAHLHQIHLTIVFQLQAQENVYFLKPFYLFCKQDPSSKREYMAFGFFWICKNVNWQFWATEIFVHAKFPLTEWLMVTVHRAVQCCAGCTTVQHGLSPQTSRKPGLIKGEQIG